MTASKATVTRTVLLIIAIINMILQTFGKNVLPFTDDEVSQVISIIFMAVTAIMSWWKNNSFSTCACKADSVLDKIRSGEQGSAERLTFDEFVDKYIGRGTDYDSVYGVQCVDLAKLYIDKCFGVTPKAIGNAHAYYDNFNKHAFLYKNFTRISNTPDFVPQKGDIVVWSKALSSSKTGHIAIASGVGNKSTFVTYDQNWGKTNKDRVMRKVEHSYYCVLGVLRPNDKSIFTSPKSKKPSLKAGNVYITTRVRGLYEGVGDNTGRKVYSKIVNSNNEDSLINDNGKAYYKKGTAFTCLEYKTKSNGNIWARSPSGWLCVYDKKPNISSIKSK